MFRLRPSHIAIAASLAFFLAGQAFIPLLGIEADEALFGMAFLQPRGAVGVRIGHTQLPLMLMSYLGTLKAWIYRPLFQWFRPGVRMLREPMLLAGALSIWLFYLLMKRMAGPRAAAIGSVLLAVDAPYLLTATFDWGPVALQHLLLIAGALLLLRFCQEKRERSLAGGAFLLGLALWDKALASWMISGMGIAALILCWREIRSLVTPRRLAIGAAAFLLGCLPLVVYNMRYDWATFHGNFKRDFSQISGKAGMLVNTVNGHGLFGYLSDEDWHTPAPHRPSGVLQSASARISQLTGGPRESVAFYALVLALLLTPLAGRDHRRAILFGLVAMLLAWIQMAITAQAGASVHHTILLWPLPQLIVAVSLAAASTRLGRAGKPVVASFVTVLVVSGLLVTNQYFTMMLRNGGSQSWTDAIFPLSTYIRTVPATSVVAMDWGILDGLRFLSRGRLPLNGDDDRAGRPDLLADTSTVYVAHTKAFQVFPANEKFLQFAEESRYRREILTVISDSFGRPTFEVYRFLPPSE